MTGASVPNPQTPRGRADPTRPKQAEGRGPWTVDRERSRDRPGQARQAFPVLWIGALTDEARVPVPGGAGRADNWLHRVRLDPAALPIPFLSQGTCTLHVHTVQHLHPDESAWIRPSCLHYARSGDTSERVTRSRAVAGQMATYLLISTTETHPSPSLGLQKRGTSSTAVRHGRPLRYQYRRTRLLCIGLCPEKHKGLAEREVELGFRDAGFCQWDQR